MTVAKLTPRKRAAKPKDELVFVMVGVRLPMSKVQTLSDFANNLSVGRHIIECGVSDASIPPGPLPDPDELSSRLAVIATECAKEARG